MNKMKKIFTDIDMNYKNLIIYAVLSATVVALINCIPFLKDTSFTLPAATYEVWILLALVVICNCKTSTEAMLKTFIYFVISQPLIYLIEVPFNDLGFGLFRYYIFWAKMTILTIPGAYIAYQVKRQNILSAIVLSIATTYLVYSGIDFFKTTISDFPRYLVAVIYCILSSIFLILALLPRKKERIVAFLLTIIFTTAIYLYTVLFPPVVESVFVLEEDHTWEIISSEANTTIRNDNLLVVTSPEEGEYEIVLINENNEEFKYVLTIDGEENSLDLIEY